VRGSPAEADSGSSTTWHGRRTVWGDPPPLSVLRASHIDKPILWRSRDPLLVRHRQGSSTRIAQIKLTPAWAVPWAKSALFIALPRWLPMASDFQVGASTAEESDHCLRLGSRFFQLGVGPSGRCFGRARSPAGDLSLLGAWAWPWAWIWGVFCCYGYCRGWPAGCGTSVSRACLRECVQPAVLAQANVGGGR